MSAALEQLRTDYDYVVSVGVLDHVRRLLEATRPGGVSSAVWQQAIQKRPSIMDLEGLGQQIWRGLDAQRYIEQLRGEWDAR